MGSGQKTLCRRIAVTWIRKFREELGKRYPDFMEDIFCDLGGNPFRSHTNRRNSVKRGLVFWDPNRLLEFDTIRSPVNTKIMHISQNL